MKVCAYHDGCPPDGPACKLCAHLQPKVWNKRDPEAPADAVYVGRGSPYGNPFRIEFGRGRKRAIERFRCEVLPTLDVAALRGRDLVCFCAPKPCHADLILEKANARTD